EDAADATEGDGSTKKGRAQRHAAGVVVLTSAGTGRIEGNRLEWLARIGKRESRTENLVDDDRAVGLLQTLDEEVELVAIVQIATHVDLVLEDVGQRPGELMASRRRQNTRGALV